jgi:hypothetical protein
VKQTEIHSATDTKGWRKKRMTNRMYFNIKSALVAVVLAGFVAGPANALDVELDYTGTTSGKLHAAAAAMRNSRMC